MLIQSYCVSHVHEQTTPRDHVLIEEAMDTIGKSAYR
jgi:hypothetical protein